MIVILNKLWYFHNLWVLPVIVWQTALTGHSKNPCDNFDIWPPLVPKETAQTVLYSARVGARLHFPECTDSLTFPFTRLLITLIYYTATLTVFKDSQFWQSLWSISSVHACLTLRSLCSKFWYSGFCPFWIFAQVLLFADCLTLWLFLTTILDHVLDSSALLIINFLNLHLHLPTFPDKLHMKSSKFCVASLQILPITNKIIFNIVKFI